AIAAVRTIRTLDDPAYLELLRGTLESRGTELTSGGLGTGLRALGYLARNEDDREGVREVLSGYLADLRRSVRIAAIDALGELRDPQATGRVQTFVGDKIDVGVRRAAEKAVKSMREAKRVPVELSDLRVELVELREQHDELAEEFAALKERMEAVAETDAGESDAGVENMDASDAPPDDGGADAPVDED
ncbi:MAG: HEAT repeat domain-containing protein, partial [Candidatus Poribacteria bacterium]